MYQHSVQNLKNLVEVRICKILLLKGLKLMLPTKTVCSIALHKLTFSGFVFNGFNFPFTEVQSQKVNGNWELLVR